MVTKPTVGILDLATGAASAVRDSSRSSSKEIPRRIRPPRLVVGPGGILPRFSERQGRGQEILFELNRHLCDVLYTCHFIRMLFTKKLLLFPIKFINRKLLSPTRLLEI